MAFSATVEQMRNGTKTVTRRDVNKWGSLVPGERLLVIEKGMGLRKGERQIVIGEIEIVDVRVEPLCDITDEDVAAEGFPGHDTAWFFENVWTTIHGHQPPHTPVRRIEFRHIAGDAS
ncbi:MAG: ASCH domain-containing protein [Actinomycetota bacterium]